MIITELPSDEVAAILALDHKDYKGEIWYRTKTMKAFTLEEFTDIVNKLP